MIHSPKDKALSGRVQHHHQKSKVIEVQSEGDVDHIFQCEECCAHGVFATRPNSQSTHLQRHFTRCDKKENQTVVIKIFNTTYFDNQTIIEKSSHNGFSILYSSFYYTNIKNYLSRQTFSAYFSPHHILAILINFKFTHIHIKNNNSKKQCIFSKNTSCTFD